MTVIPIRQSDDGLARRLWRLANHDFCPEQNRWAYKLRNPLAVLLSATVVAVFCGIMINPLAYAVAASLAVAVVTGLAWREIVTRRVDVWVDWGRVRVSEGDTVEVRVRFRNRLPVPVWGLRLVGLGGVEEAVLPTLRAFEEREVCWRTEAVRRGVFPCGEVRPAVETALPFGVRTGRQATQVSGRLTVWPATADLPGRLDIGSTRDGEDRTTDRRAGDSGDLIGVRRFRVGDSLRRVHWVQTARQRELVVCERQASVSAAVRVGADLTTDADELETTLRAAASVVRSLTRAGTSVELWLGPRRERPSSDPRTAWDAMAAVRKPPADQACPADVDVRVGPHGVTALGDDWQASLLAAWRRACRAA